VSLLHTVLLRFEPELPPDLVDEMRAQVRSWPEEIGGFEELAIGPPLLAERTQGYHYLLHIVVADEAALERYQVHPVHQRFASWVRDHGGGVLAFDYLLDADTVVVPGVIGD
jgi:Stress responsive A/B Barrel Domain